MIKQMPHLKPLTYKDELQDEAPWNCQLENGWGDLNQVLLMQNLIPWILM